MSMLLLFIGWGDEALLGASWSFEISGAVNGAVPVLNLLPAPSGWADFHRSRK